MTYMDIKSRFRYKIFIFIRMSKLFFFKSIFDIQLSIKVYVRRAAGRRYSYFHSMFACAVFLLIYSLCHTSWPNVRRYRPEIWYTHFPRPHLRRGSCFFVKMTLRADFPHISSIALDNVRPPNK